MRQRKPWAKWYRQLNVVFTESSDWYARVLNERDETVDPERWGMLDEQCQYLWHLSHQVSLTLDMLARRPRWR